MLLMDRIRSWIDAVDKKMDELNGGCNTCWSWRSVQEQAERDLQNAPEKVDAVLPVAELFGVDSHNLFLTGVNKASSYQRWNLDNRGELLAMIITDTDDESGLSYQLQGGIQPVGVGEIFCLKDRQAGVSINGSFFWIGVLLVNI
jgi:hypothetical protein